MNLSRRGVMSDNMHVALNIANARSLGSLLDWQVPSRLWRELMIDLGRGEVARAGDMCGALSLRLRRIWLVGPPKGDLGNQGG